MSEGHDIIVVVGEFEPLGGVETAELERIVARHLPVLATQGRGFEYELLIRLKVRKTSSGVAWVQDTERPGGAMLVAARDTSRSPDVVEVLTAVRRAPRSLHAETDNRSDKVARVVPGEKPLTDRETTVLEALSEGLTNPEIADALHITPRTVHSHVRRIFRKLGVHNRRELIGMLVPERENWRRVDSYCLSV